MKAHPGLRARAGASARTQVIRQWRHVVNGLPGVGRVGDAEAEIEVVGLDQLSTQGARKTHWGWHFVLTQATASSFHQCQEPHAARANAKTASEAAAAPQVHSTVRFG